MRMQDGVWGLEVFNMLKMNLSHREDFYPYMQPTLNEVGSRSDISSQYQNVSLWFQLGTSVALPLCFVSTQPTAFQNAKCRFCNCERRLERFPRVMSHAHQFVMSLQAQSTSIAGTAKSLGLSVASVVLPCFNLRPRPHAAYADGGLSECGPWDSDHAFEILPQLTTDKMR